MPSRYSTEPKCQIKLKAYSVIYIYIYTPKTHIKMEIKRERVRENSVTIS